MADITGGELFARALQAEGIEFLFGLPSPEIDPLLAQLSAHGIRMVPVRHEAAGVHMAEGLYKTTGKVAAVLGKAQGLGCHGEYVDRIEDLDGALSRAREHAGASLICLRTDHDANLSIPAEMMTRFFEVYSGPAKPATV